MGHGSQLTIEERNHLALLGRTHAVVVGQRDGDRLLQAEDYDGWLVRGWCAYNEGMPDIVWTREAMTGWPPGVVL